MIIHALREKPAAQLSARLAEFERGFRYPLGPGRWFRISHGEDYPRFFRSMGLANCFVAEQGEEIVGAVSVAIRPLLMPDGQVRQSAYVGDLKVAAGLRGSLVFLKLAQAALAWARPQVSCGFGVVMEGTATSPTSYTGRVGIPACGVVGRILVVRLASEAGEVKWVATAKEGEKRWLELSRGRYAALGAVAEDRSQLNPTWIVHPSGEACGRLEDTRRAKRLIDGEDKEMVSAHLANFVFSRPQAGAELVGAARRLAATHGLPAMFVAVGEKDYAAIEGALAGVEKVVAPATVYGAGLREAAGWNINSSEI